MIKSPKAIELFNFIFFGLYFFKTNKSFEEFILGKRGITFLLANKSIEILLLILFFFDVSNELLLLNKI